MLLMQLVLVLLLLGCWAPRGTRAGRAFALIGVSQQKTLLLLGGHLTFVAGQVLTHLLVC